VRHLDAVGELSDWAEGSPVGAAVASGTSIVGLSVFVGSGLAEMNSGPNTLPPGNNGIWSFTTASAGAPPSLSGIAVP
jgi:hypothetical protein